MAYLLPYIRMLHERLRRNLRSMWDYTTLTGPSGDDLFIAAERSRVSHTVLLDLTVPPGQWSPTGGRAREQIQIR
jgi:hypothetical protein